MPPRATTVVDDDLVSELPATAAGDDLWVRAADLSRSGWERKPEGLCRGTLCVPLPAALARDDGAVNLAGLARHRGQVVVHDGPGTVWLFGQPGETLTRAHSSLEAPDFTLPDLEGRPHALAAERGKKVLIVSWASW